ncbi:hypothetical protein ACGFW5_12685 [Streptomyces sp. NPDC048416]|uniref:hypothetical protein n=1 Tax=Streptomyces sp. NPDC048416 TaxID=3365546 RepID=UPI0037201FFC
MEQRSEHQYMPLAGAATDPAYVPGLVPAPAIAPDEGHASDAGTETDAAPEAGENAGDRKAVEQEPAQDGAAPADEDAERAGSEADENDGPACEMSDRQGSIVADRKGVRLQLGDEEAEFRWDEVSAVEYRAPRWSRRFEIVVYTSAPRRFSHDVEAADRAGRARWAEQLDAVLDAYFED